MSISEQRREAEGFRNTYWFEPISSEQMARAWGVICQIEMKTHRMKHSPNEAMRLRYNPDGTLRNTLSSVAEQMGIKNNEQVRSLLARATRKMRMPKFRQYIMDGKKWVI